MRNTLRAHFSIFRRDPNAVLITDNNDGAMSVTNNAEAVVEWLITQFNLGPGTRIIYRDCDGRWDELKHDGSEFTDFGLLTDAERRDLNIP